MLPPEAPWVSIAGKGAIWISHPTSFFFTEGKCSFLERNWGTSWEGCWSIIKHIYHRWNIGPIQFIWPFQKQDCGYYKKEAALVPHMLPGSRFC